MTPCNRYTKEFISRVADNEVRQEAHSVFLRHAKTCAACAETLADFRQMGQLFSSHTEAEVGRIRTELPPITVTAPQGAQNRKGLWGWIGRMGQGLASVFGRGAMGLKLASLSAVALILAVSLYTWQGDSGNGMVPGPSAIVNSVDTYGSSVMIIETPESHHTIIWFSET
ncbi:MAG TPA: hypothetical protein DHV36_06475 [Desulfobacteraceae bacterium]|nr:hypothetical protein [Desulfobacteraceae bacterium]|tara:strand:+ start:133 stop:642 length:510 start_codon:yes stop_codon:yes gene_type:complete